MTVLADSAHPPVGSNPSTGPSGDTLPTMDLTEPRTFALFLEIYGTLPRAGPGSTVDTLRALHMLPNQNPRTILDLGCGPGPQTLVLAEVLPDAEILAVDLTPSMAAEAERRCRGAGFGDRVRVVEGDLLAPEVPLKSQDLIWCEGAIYFAGVEEALLAWAPLLAPGGAAAFTESIWIHHSPPNELVAWWRGEYPGITDESGVRALIKQAGYETVGSFVLPADSWRDEYYVPMQDRIIEFRAVHRNDETAKEIADSAETEIEMFRRFSEYYSYGFFVVQPRDDL